eukprot:CAMPEP_0169147616 /NCGR_PEP_ID=MMETSP1015-20121227/48334_1 /TAXON_ID=342587 /ORGANISM="Karlodinium micrum, Strain CCMP2283" /LENGTH=96 /DNA_ID=CAMNT_0009215873 /DNA_START=1 /DNA_END=288 /DNA_ORIENTATION=+
MPSTERSNISGNVLAIEVSVAMPFKSAAIACGDATPSVSSRASPNDIRVVAQITNARCSAKPCKGRISAAMRISGEAAIPRRKSMLALTCRAHDEQ